MGKSRPKKIKVENKDMKIDATIDKLKTNPERFTILIGLVTIFYSILNFFYDYNYKLDCESFYRIPAKYFSTNINNKLLNLLIICILIILVFIPMIMRKREVEKSQISVGTTIYVSLYSLILGLSIGFLNFLNLIYIMKELNLQNIVFSNIYSWLFNNATIIMFIMITSGTISLVCLTFIHEIKNVKLRWIKKILKVIFMISLIMNALLMFYGTIFRLNNSIENKTKYEIVTINKVNYVVITEVNDDLILIARYKVDDEGKYNIITNEYEIVEKFSLIYSYIDTKVTPGIIY